MKDRIMRVFWAAVLMIGVIGNLAACGKVTKTNGGQVKAALDKDCDGLSWQWIKIMFSRLWTVNGNL